jgi:TRAP-type C4-dicarboxylate transport system substrate-binding protein
MLKRALLALAIVTLLVPAAAQSQGKEIRFKFGTLAPDNTPWSKLLVDFQKEMDKRSGGRAKMKTFLGGILGDERAMLQKMKFGQLQGGGFSTGGLATVAPELQLLEIPFLFRNSEETDYVLDHVIREDMAKALEKRGLLLLSWAENGWIDFGNQKRPIRTPADLKDIKWFTQESDVGIAFYKALGATAVPLAVPEVLSSLQTGVVEGYDTTPVFASGAQWFSQTKYWTVSHHRYQPAAVVADMKFWNKLDKADQDMALLIARELEPRSRSEVRGLDEGLLKGFREQGIQINELTDKERAEFEKVTTVVGENLVKQGVIPAELLKKTQKALADYRAGKVKK